MFDPKVYRNACRELNASEEKIKEIIAMTENKDRKNSRRTMRTILVACAAITMMVVGVGAANPEAAQEIFGQIVSVIKVDQYRQDMIMDTGEHITTLEVPQATVENRDGQAILVVNGEEVDITEELEADGSYVYDRTTFGTHLRVTVEGNVEKWEMAVSIGEADGEEYGTVYYDSETVEDALGGSFMNGLPFEQVEAEQEEGMVTIIGNGENDASPRTSGTLNQK
ncbi:hypothetical protein H8S11_07375 [Flintibacter sp. NSJ-23]|uniref:DUF4179 domain-containing protein n=1 Tax=Flintibacter hominis TaxID=2763048 RepID=A0A8J6M346_9FIRM|nr:hypothetical protein [Flintibacter hominis]MBC5722630.1 hypothetical protein [Flintibacter hominis]MBS5590490.1 hypothetical protein [Clostridiales bacterium]